MKKQIDTSMEGFTLIELIMVIIIMAIVAVMVMPRWTATSLTFEYQSRRVLEDIRYAQGLSVNSGQRYRFVKTSSTTYQVLNEAGSAVLLPSGETSVTLTDGVTLGSFTNLPNNLVAFDSLGIPYTTDTYPGTALASTAVIPLSSGSNTHSIQISPETGYGSLL
jgi:prepilin-type N-terminal cleavage/methylation domain-containing protein